MSELYDRCGRAFNGLVTTQSEPTPYGAYTAVLHSGARAGREVMRFFEARRQEQVNYYVILLADAAAPDGTRRIVIYHSPEVYGLSSVVTGGTLEEVESFLHASGV
jgi:hypothetical protein